jgi:transposase
MEGGPWWSIAKYLSRLMWPGRKHAAALAEGGRAGEIRFLGEVEKTPATIERMIKKLAGQYARLHVCF